jgi:hypothetical protein
MATPAQVLANRDNAKLSTGPITAEGKLAASRNSTRHGLTGTQIVMPGEDAAAYEELRTNMHKAYAPANDPERVLVDQVAAGAWRLMRAQRVETAVLTKLAEGADDPDAAIAAALLERPKDIARIQRYVTSAQSAYYKAMNELAKLQKARQAAEHEAALMESYALATPPQNRESHRTDSPAIGFVSHAAQIGAVHTCPTGPAQRTINQ